MKQFEQLAGSVFSGSASFASSAYFWCLRWQAEPALQLLATCSSYFVRIP